MVFIYIGLHQSQCAWKKVKIIPVHGKRNESFFQRKLDDILIGCVQVVHSFFQNIPRNIPVSIVIKKGSRGQYTEFFLR